MLRQDLRLSRTDGAPPAYGREAPHGLILTRHPSLGSSRVTESTRKITKAMQMVAAAKLRRAQEARGSRAPLCRAHGGGPRQPRLRRRVEPVGAAAARRHRPGRDPSPRRRHRRARPLRRLQLVDRPPRPRARPAAARRGQDGQDPHRRQEGPRAAPPRLRQALRRPRRPRGRQAPRLRRCARRSPATCSTASTPASSTSARSSTTASSR